MRIFLCCVLAAACTRSPEPGAPGAASPDRASGDSARPAPATTTADSVITIAGVVRHFDLEGGFFAIRGDDGVTYDPSNLADEFRRDGLRVRARARLRPDMSGIHMVGPIVDLIEIERDSTAADPAPKE